VRAASVRLTVRKLRGACSTRRQRFVGRQGDGKVVGGSLLGSRVTNKKLLEIYIVIKS
jgi:hypothetical protein